MKSETKSRRELMYHPVKRRRPGNVSELENVRAGKRPITTPSLPILLRALWTTPPPLPRVALMAVAQTDAYYCGIDWKDTADNCARHCPTGTDADYASTAGARAPCGSL